MDDPLRSLLSRVLSASASLDEDAARVRDALDHPPLLVVTDEPSFFAEEFHRALRPTNTHRVHCAGSQSAITRLAETDGGSISFEYERLPRDFLDSLAKRPTNLLYIVLAEATRSQFLRVPLVIESLSCRRNELPNIVDAFARDSCSRFDVDQSRFDDTDRAFVLAHATTFEMIATWVERFIADKWHNDVVASMKLGTSRTTLRRWRTEVEALGYVARRRRRRSDRRWSRAK